MADVYVIIRYQITQGEGDGDELAVFESLDDAQRAFDAGRASGEYVDDGSPWSGARAYELAKRSAEGYLALDGTNAGPACLIAPPSIYSPQLGSTWSWEPSRRRNWPG